jgi:spore germination protein
VSKFKTICSIAFISLAPLLLTGCWDQRLFEEVGFTLQMGIEKSDAGELTITRTSPVVASQLERNVEILSDDGGSLLDTREKASRVSPKRIEGGKVQQILFSEALASEGGLQDIMEIFERQPAENVLSYVVVVEGSPKELIEASSGLEDKPRPAFYLRQLLDDNVKDSYIPETRVYRYNIDYYSPGIDPMTPLIKLDKEGIRIKGSALFSGGKMAGKIDDQQTVLMLAMKDEMRGAQYLFGRISKTEKESQYKTQMSIFLRRVKRKIDISIKEDKLTVDIQLKFNATLDEDKWACVGESSQEKEIQEKLEEELARRLTEDCMKVIKYTQEVGSDPIGIGDIIRAKHKDYWKNNNWEESYKNANIKVEAKLEIKQYGVIK